MLATTDGSETEQSNQTSDVPGMLIKSYIGILF